MLHHMSSSEYLNYENTKFSKSKGVGVFGTDALETGIPADVWRFYIFYNRPEKSDAQFTWKDFQEKVNAELIGNLANLVNRTLTFLKKNYNGMVPSCGGSAAFNEQIRPYFDQITGHLERAELREAFRKTFFLSSLGNKAFQEAEPWKTVKNDPATTAPLLKDLVYLVRDLAILVSPYIPATSEKIATFLGNPDMSWSSLGRREDLTAIGKPVILFNRLENKTVEAFRQKFSGSQEERREREVTKEAVASLEEQFREAIELRVAKITAIKRHPEAEKLYIETIDLGDQERCIVSGLVPHYKEEELLNRNIILVANLKPSKLRGVKSMGMLLAADGPDEGGNKTVEVLFADHAAPGTRVVLRGDDAEKLGSPKQLKIDKFFAIPMTLSEGTVMVGETPLTIAGEAIKTSQVKFGEVG